MRFLICGLGSVGRRHLRNLRSLGVEDIVLYRTGRSTLPEAELEDYPVEHDLDAALERWQPAAALVTNPTALHLEVAIPAARAGCHLFIEKPVSHAMDGLDELREALAAGAGRTLVGFQFRFNPGLRKAWELLEQGTIGRPLSAHVHWGEYLPDWHPWEDYRQSYSARADLGGGVVLTHCHPFDYLRWLLGEVSEVTALTRSTAALEIDVEDQAEVLLELQSGCLANVHLDYNQRPPSHQLQVIGTEGTLLWDGLTGVLRWWASAAQTWRQHDPPAGFERNSMFLDEMRHFIAVAKGEAEPVCSLQDGIRATQIALAAHRSARERRAVPLIQLPAKQQRAH